MIYTIGHSNYQDFDVFTHLLTGAGIKCLVDVRSHPVSHLPHFSRMPMTAHLYNAGIQYIWMPDLGGWTARHLSYQPFLPEVNLAAYAGARFPKHEIAKKRKPGPGPEWTSLGLYHYSFFTLLGDFQRAAAGLVNRIQGAKIAICCAEGLWWKCHRSMISDYLLAVYAIDSCHILPDGRQSMHSQCLGDRLQRYDISILLVWMLRAGQLPGGRGQLPLPVSGIDAATNSNLFEIKTTGKTDDRQWTLFNIFTGRSGEKQ